MDLDGLLSGGAVGGADPPTVLLAVSILPNADVTIASQDLLPDAIIASEESGKTSSTGIKKEEDNGATGPKSEKQRQEEESRKFRVLGKWGKALELAGDVGLWVEWVKKFAEQKNGREGSMPQ